MNPLQRKKALILEQETAFARAVGRAVLLKPKVSYWMVLLPILFVYFVYRLQGFKKERATFEKEFMTTRRRALDVAFEAVGLSATSQQTLEVTRNKGAVVWAGNNQRMIEIDMQAIVTRELTVLGSYGMSDQEFQRSLQMLADGRIPAGQLINRRASLSEGPQLFDQLLASPETIKCMINF